MPPGPKPLPTKLKMLRGNPGKRPLPRHEPQPAPVLPDPPDHLGPLALAEWQRVAPELHRIGVLTMVDRTALAAYCQLYERWVYAERLIQEHLLIVDAPTKRIMQNPLIRIANRTLELLRAYAGELGLTPASRPRLVGGTPPVDDPLEQFLAQRRPRR